MNGGAMNAERLLDVYEQISEAPDAIARLRRFVLDLAVRGKLVEQDAADEPASQQLDRIAFEKARLVKAKQIRKPKALQKKDALKIPFATPKGWSWACIDELSPRSLTDGDWIETKDQAEDGGVRLIQLADVGVGCFLNKSSRFITAETEVRLNCTRLSKGDILIARLPNPIGRACIFPELEQPAITAVDVAILRPDGNISADYVVVAVNSPPIRDQIEAYGKGATRFRVSTGHLKTVLIPVPPLAEQHRIVAKVDELMALCDRLEEAHKTREEVRGKLTAASLVRLTAPDTKAEDFPTHAAFALEALPALTTRADQIKTLRQTILNLAVRGKLVDCESGSLEKVGTYRKLQNGYAFKSGWFEKSGIRLLRNANVGHGDIRWTDTVYLPEEIAEEYQRFALNEDDIVLTLDRPFIVTGTKVARVKASDLPSLLLQRVGRFVSVREGLADDYLFMWINSLHFNDQIDPGRSNGVPHISSKQVEAAVIFLPSLAEQLRIVAQVKALMTLCDQLEAALTSADTTRSRLLEVLLHEALEPAAATLAAAE